MTDSVADSEGNFSVYLPIPADMELGPRVVRAAFLGEVFVLPSNGSTVFTVYAPTIITLNPLAPAAVGDLITISGKVTDNLPVGSRKPHCRGSSRWGIHWCDIDWPKWNLVLTWTIPETLSVGNHSIEAIAPQQGFYRQSSVGGTLAIATTQRFP